MISVHPRPGLLLAKKQLNSETEGLRDCGAIIRAVALVAPLALVACLVTGPG